MTTAGKPSPMPALVLAAALALAAALSAGCGSKTALLLPAPPKEIPKPLPAAAAVPSPAPPPAPPPAPGPDYPRMYREAVARSREAIGNGAPHSAVPGWVALENSPFAAEALFNQGVLLQLSGDLPGAEDKYRRAAAPPLLSERAAANLLGVVMLRGDAEALREVVDNVLAPISRLPGKRIPEFTGNLAAALSDLSRFDAAESLFLSMEKTGIRTPAFQWNRSVLAYRRGDLAAARRFFAAVPPETASLWPVAASRPAWERDAAAVPPLDETAPGAQRYLPLSRNLSAHEAWKNGQAEAALDLLRPIASPRTAPAEFRNNLGILLGEAGRWKEAKETLERTVSDAPALSEGWLNLGLFRELYLGDTAGAISCYEMYGTLNGRRRDETSKWSEWLKKSSSAR